MRTAYGRAAVVLSLIANACSRPAHPIERAAPGSRSAVAPPSTSVPVTQDGSTARWVRPTGIAHRAKLLAFDPSYPWDFGSAPDGPSGHGVYARGTFKLVAPGPQSGREFDVVFACNTEGRLSPPLGKGIGHIYGLELPEYFFEGNVRIIDDCDFPRVGWTCPDAGRCDAPQ